MDDFFLKYGRNNPHADGENECRGSRSLFDHNADADEGAGCIQGTGMVSIATELIMQWFFLSYNEIVTVGA